MAARVAARHHIIGTFLGIDGDTCFLPCSLAIMFLSFGWGTDSLHLRFLEQFSVGLEFEQGSQGCRARCHALVDAAS